MDAAILVEGRNCWRMPRADRVAVLVDAADYFCALAAAIERAERSILMLGWDFHSRVELLRDGSGPEQDGLTARLEAAVRRQPRLQVHILEWDFAVIYALEREAMPLLRFGFQTHDRIHFRMDDQHPLGASHHQKIVVVDDKVAFSGGLDVTACRWDTSDHAAEEPRRSDPGFGSYGPFHDVQMAVDGEAARALGELARGRWERATGHRLEAPQETESDPWPADLEPGLRDVSVAIARTEPRSDEADEVREVERLYVDSIEAARSWIYIENQYFTSAKVGDALAESLARPEGPEIVVVLTRSCSGWLEEATMGVMRANLLRRLGEADAHGRLAVHHPTLPGVDDDDFTVHAKVFLSDGRLLRVGSANLSNRSMGLDTECDLAIEAGDDATAEAVDALRDRLLGEHLGVEPGAVARAVAETGSLRRALESLRGGERTLVPLEPDASEWSSRVAAAVSAFDMERPVEFEDLVESFLPEGEEQSLQEGPGRGRSIAIGLGLLLGLAALWRFTPLSELASPERLSELAAPLRRSGTGPLLAYVLFVAASLAMFPVTVLIVTAALLFGWWTGAIVGLAGALTSAVAAYAVGRVLWRDAVRRLAGRRLNRLSRRLSRRGVMAMAAVRLVPIAPFTVVNVTAGASHIRLRDFALGTLLGMGPGTVMLALAADRAVAAVSDPDLTSIAVAVAVVVLLVAGGAWLRRRAEAVGPGGEGGD